MRRTLQTVAVPVFQFGLFSENDLSFFAGPDFNFGGRVHTNANVYLASGNGTTLTLSDRITAVGEVIRTNLSNGWDTNTNYTGTVRVIRAAPATFRNLARTEGSLVTNDPAVQNEPNWTTLSVGTYASNIRNGRTGARRLDLPLVSQGAQADRSDSPAGAELERERRRRPAHLRSALLRHGGGAHPAVGHGGRDSESADGHPRDAAGAALRWASLTHNVLDYATPLPDLVPRSPLGEL